MLKHAVWLGIACWTGGAWIIYYVDAPTVTVGVLDRHGIERSVFLRRPVHRDDLLAGRLGARAGLHLHVPVAALPGGHARRAERHRHLSGLARRTAARGKRHEGEPAGDCVDCGLCVTVCPTGIDIRDGMQLECIGCGLCIDACNQSWSKVDRNG